MKQLFLKHFFHIFSILIFSGCAVDIGKYAGNIDTIDTNNLANDKNITTKIVNQTFNLDIIMNATDMSDEKYFTGTFSHTLFSGTTAVTSTTVVDYGTIQGGTTNQMTSNFNVASASKDTFSQLSTCFRSENCTGDRIENGICEKCDGSLLFGVCIGSWISARWDFTTDNDMTTCTNQCPLVEVCIDSNGYITDATPSSCLFGTSTGVKLIPCYINHSSVDHFAVRPKNYTITKIDATPLINLISADNINLKIDAKDSINVNTINYTASPIINISIINYYKADDTLSTSMSGLSSISTNPNFIDGTSSDAQVKFDNVGKVTIHLEDRDWTAIDIDDTPQDCSQTGAYICGDVNATFIPKKFSYENISLENSDNLNRYTYLANTASSVGAVIVGDVKAVNSVGVTTSNFNATSGWSKDVNLSISKVTSSNGDFTSVKTQTFTLSKSRFTDGNTTGNSIVSSDALRFNLDKNNSNPKNPINVKVSNITLNSISSDVATDSKALVVGNDAIDSNATFIYGRTHSPSYRFTGASGTAYIYYEAYCSGTDSNGTVCDMSLLPGGLNSNFSDDPRWYINSNHDESTQGIAGLISAKNGASISSVVSSNTNKVTTTLTNNTGITGYKVTMKNSADTWLVYDKYNNSNSDNEFDVEFGGATQLGWSGVKKINEEVDSSSTNTNSGTVIEVNRRTNW